MKNLNVYYENGKVELIDTIKMLLYRKFPGLFEKLDFDNDRIFSEPLLFGYFSIDEPGMTIEQILFGYISDEKKPASISVCTNREGIVYLPAIGYFITPVKNKLLTMSRAGESGDLSFYFQRNEIEYQKEALLYLDAAPGVELCLYSNPIYTQILENWEAEENTTIETYKSIPNFREEYIRNPDYINELNKNALAHLEGIETAYTLIKKHYPAEYEKYIDSTRRIICFENPYMRGFAFKNVHGTIFLSVNPACNETFFIDEIVHQCSHNVFNCMTTPIEDYVRIDPDKVLKDLTGIGHNHEIRGFYNAFHGLYTVSACTKVLLKIYREHRFEKQKELEFLGRLAIERNRFRTGIEKVNLEEVLTDEGMDIYNTLDQHTATLIKNNPDVFQGFNFSNQPFVYSFEKFLELNPVSG